MAKLFKKKIVKPTAAEQKIIDARLKEMYPQMYERPAGEIAMFRGLSLAERKKLLRMVSKKLKHLHGSKETWKLKKIYQ